MQLWQIHVAEQMILDDVEANPGKYKDKKLSELTDTEDLNEENSIEYSKAYYKKTLVPKVILVSTSLLGIVFGSMLWHLLSVVIFVCRKQALKNLTWRLPLLSVRSAAYIYISSP